MALFVGRKNELTELERFAKKATSSLIVIRGRRRIGKSRLVEEFAKPYTFYSFAGLPPAPGATAQSQRDEFSRQLSRETGLPEVKADDWSKLFLLLSEKISNEMTVVFFDEISWMGSEDPEFLGKIKHAWDTMFKAKPKLIFIICGSASYWIEKNILSSTGFLGRISYTLTLGELSLSDCVEFWGKYSKNISAYEKFKIISVTGGVPKYLEEIDPKISAEDNIKNLCFKSGGFLADEFERIFSDLFLRNSSMYKDIVIALASGPKDTVEISDILNVGLSGKLSEYLEELAQAGFVTRDYTWNLKNGADSRLSHYRLSDNYLRFYLKYIKSHHEKIKRGTFAFKSLSSLPAWDAMMGLQFENLILSNRKEIHYLLSIHAEDIITENPFFQRKNTKQEGCQIDYLVQTKFNTLYLCEVKFSKNPIGVGIVGEVQRKVDSLALPKGFSVRPVLIHVNGISSEVDDANYFSSIIDFSSLLVKK